MSSTRLPNRKRRELRDALSHVAYEAEALRRASDCFRRRSRRFDLEAALVHARNLTEFFWAPSRKHRAHPDAVYASHYISPEQWKQRRSTLPQNSIQLFAAMCAQVSHISVNRNRKDVAVDFAAELPGIVQALDEAWVAFREALSTSDWMPTLRRSVTQWQSAE